MKNRPLTAVDALGRTILAPPAADTLRPRLTGLFYFLWLRSGRHRLYDISKITAADPQAGYKPESPVWGRVGDYHFWGEPFYGYYSQLDEWVVRRHMKLIMAADIDFLFFDTTNAAIYKDAVKLVMRVLQEYHDDGFAVPKVMFYTNTRSGRTVRHIYDSIYRPQWCPDTWFCMEGKPVIIARREECSPAMRAYFNIQKAQWPNEPDKAGGWPWMDFTRPQRLFCDESGAPAVMNVSVAQHPQLHFGDSVLYGETTNCGRAWHDGANDPAPNAFLMGYNLAEQFQRAWEADPPMLLITGWNEWIAGRWKGSAQRPISFVDCANYEYSRDIEMMRGGYFDNYYMQLVDGVRRYKGCRGLPAVPPDTVQVYEGFADGAMPRCARGWTAHVYRNTTQRNAIRRMELMHKRGLLHLCVAAAAPIPQDVSGSFMNVFLSLGRCPGFDFVVGRVTHVERSTPDGFAGTMSVEAIRRPAAAPRDDRPCDALTDTAALGQVDFTVRGERLTLALPLALLGLPQSGFEVWFKVADSRVPYTRVDDFYDLGDCAPLGRLCHIYRAQP